MATASGGLVLFSGCAARAQAAVAKAAPPAPTPPNTPGAPGAHTVRPLPFNPATLKGLSEKLITSHHDNNYAGAVKNLNKVEEELARVTKDTPAFLVGGLRQSELSYRNSATLHELYFANLGGDGRMSGTIENALGTSFGSTARWEEQFRAVAASLAGGSGWVLLNWDLHREALAISWSGNHTQGASASMPLLVLDMYEHAYQMDYGAAAAKYIEAFFANIHWDEVTRRFERVRNAARH
jgi:superoxide dismutase, Fe-Mn family